MHISEVTHTLNQVSVILAMPTCYADIASGNYVTARSVQGFRAPTMPRRARDALAALAAMC